MEKYPVKYAGPRDDGEAERPSKIRCRQCGNETYSSLVICPNCGRELVAAAPRGLTYGVPIALIALFFIAFLGWSSRNGVSLNLADLLPGDGIAPAPVVELEPNVIINETPEITLPSLVPEKTKSVPAQIALASPTALPTIPTEPLEPATAIPTDRPTVPPTEIPTLLPTKTLAATTSETAQSETIEAELPGAEETAAEQNVITVANLVATLAAAPTSTASATEEIVEPTVEPTVDRTATVVAVETSSALQAAAAAARLTAEAPTIPTDTPTVMPTDTPTDTPTAVPTSTPTATETVTTTPTERPTSTAEPTNTPSVTPTAKPSATKTASATPTSSATKRATKAPTTTPTSRPTRTKRPTVTISPTATQSPTTVVPPTATLSPTPSPVPVIIHEIRGGDTLLALARQYGTTVNKLMAANDLTTEDVRRLRPGQKLIIPSSTSDAATVGETVSVPTTEESEPPTTPTATPKPVVYVMKAGDNPLKIALSYGVSVEALLAVNGLTRDDATRLRIGTELVIPGTGATTSNKNAAQNQASGRPIRRSGSYRLDAPILRSPEDQTPMSCRAEDSLVWAPVPFMAPADTYLLHVGFVSAISEDGEPTITWILEQPRESNRTSWDLDTDYCSLAPQELGRQWRWYVEVIDEDGDAVSPPSPIWAFSWN